MILIAIAGILMICNGWVWTGILVLTGACAEMHND